MQVVQQWSRNRSSPAAPDRAQRDRAVASTLSSIGFVFEDGADFSAAMIRLAGEARERLAVAGGEYAVWRSRTGAEIWFQFAPGVDGADDEIIGLTPFYEGLSEIPVKVTAIVRRPGRAAVTSPSRCTACPATQVPR